LIMDRGSEHNKVDRPVDPRGGSTSSPELICRRQRQQLVLPTGVLGAAPHGDHRRDKVGQGRTEQSPLNNDHGGRDSWSSGVWKREVGPHKIDGGEAQATGVNGLHYARRGDLS
jgi:hypothetical protein